MEGLCFRRALRVLDAQFSVALLRGRGGTGPGQGHPDPRHPAAGDGGQPERGQHRRLPRPRPGQPTRGVRRCRVHSHPFQGDLGRTPLLLVRGEQRVCHEDAKQLRRVAARHRGRDGVLRQARQPGRDRQSHRPKELSQPTAGSGGSGAHGQVPRRSGRHQGRARAHQLRSVPVPVDGNVDAHADEALGLPQGRRGLRQGRGRRLQGGGLRRGDEEPRLPRARQ